MEIMSTQLLKITKRAVAVLSSIVLITYFSIVIAFGKKDDIRSEKYLQFQAHRGVSVEAPENTMAAYRAAAKQFFTYIEVDPAATKDGVIVMLHDKTITRTAKQAKQTNGAPMPDPSDYPAAINELTYADVSQFDFGVHFSERFAGEKIPRLDEVLTFAKNNRLTVKLDAKIWYLSSVNLETIFDIANSSKAKIAVTCKSIEQAQTVIARLNKAEIHYTGNVDTDILHDLKTIAGDRLYVWLPFDCKAMAWVDAEHANKSLSATVKKYAKLGIYTISTEKQLQTAISYGANIIETNGQLKPRIVKI